MTLILIGAPAFPDVVEPPPDLLPLLLLPLLPPFQLPPMGGVEGFFANGHPFSSTLVFESASYLLFEGNYCQELMQLGYDDAMKKSEAIKAFLHILEVHNNNVVAFKKA